MSDAPPADMELEYDAEVDYYKTLGVLKSSSMEDIKKAHVKLALEYHPDRKASRVNLIGPDGLPVPVVDRSLAFREVSEAWGVLSKPATRKLYDMEREVIVARAVKGYVPTGVSTEIPSSSYSTQKANYTNTVKGAASSSWKEKNATDKYRTESWQKLTLDERKATRVRQVHTPGGSMAGILGIGLLCVGGMFVAYKMMIPQRSPQNMRR